MMLTDPTTIQRSCVGTKNGKVLKGKIHHYALRSPDLLCSPTPPPGGAHGGAPNKEEGRDYIMTLLSAGHAMRTG